jgi:hypothetical protein
MSCLRSARSQSHQLLDGRRVKPVPGSFSTLGTLIALAAVRGFPRDFTNKLDPGRKAMDSLIHMVPVVSAIGYSIVYLLAGGGIFGAFVIYLIAKVMGR